MQSRANGPLHVETKSWRFKGQSRTVAQPQGRSKPSVTMASTVHVDGGLLTTFVSDKAWAKSVLDLQSDIHDQLQQELEPLVPQPMKFSESGQVKVVSRDGTTNFNVQTHVGGGGVIRHKYLSQNVMSAFGVLHTKTGVHANMEQGTPFLDIEIVGSQQSVLLAMFLSPRISTVRHKWYLNKYYKTVPGGAGGDVISFVDLYRSMMARADAKKHSVATVATGAAGGSSQVNADAAPLYTFFHSPALFTRIAAGHGALFNFDPKNPVAVNAAREDIRSMVALWCAHAKADAADVSAIIKDPVILDECREISRVAARYLEADEDTAAAKRFMSEEDYQKLFTAVSGEASTAGAPWWLL